MFTYSLYLGETGPRVCVCECVDFENCKQYNYTRIYRHEQKARSRNRTDNRK